MAAAGIVDQAVDEAVVRSAAIETAAAQAAKAGPALGTIKARMYAAVIATLHA